MPIFPWLPGPGRNPGASGRASGDEGGNGDSATMSFWGGFQWISWRFPGVFLLFNGAGMFFFLGAKLQHFCNIQELVMDGLRLYSDST